MNIKQKINLIKLQHCICCTDRMRLQLVEGTPPLQRTHAIGPFDQYCTRSKKLKSLVRTGTSTNYKRSIYTPVKRVRSAMLQYTRIKKICIYIGFFRAPMPRSFLVFFFLLLMRQKKKTF
jgi:hypothetical protein